MNKKDTVLISTIESQRAGTFEPTCYVSPFPWGFKGKMHPVLCREIFKEGHIIPSTAAPEGEVCGGKNHCRECYREANWTRGQTHGA